MDVDVSSQKPVVLQTILPCFQKGMVLEVSMGLAMNVKLDAHVEIFVTNDTGGT